MTHAEIDLICAVKILDISRKRLNRAQLQWQKNCISDEDLEAAEIALVYAEREHGHAKLRIEEEIKVR